MRKLSETPKKAPTTFLEKNLNAKIDRLKVEVSQLEAKIRQLSKVAEPDRLQKRIRRLEKENEDFSNKLTSSLLKYSILAQSKMCQTCSNGSKEKSVSVKMETDERIEALEEQNRNVAEAFDDLLEKLKVQKLRNDQTEDEMFEKCSEQTLQLFVWNDSDQDLVRKMKKNSDSFVTILNRLVNIRKREIKKLEQVKKILENIQIIIHSYR